MRNMKLFKILFFTIALATILTSCLKDDSNILDPDNTQNVIEFANSANLTSPTTSKYPLLSINVVMDAPGSHNAIVRYSGAHNAPQDITVQVDVADPSVLAFYKTQVGSAASTYTAIPSNLFTLTKTTVVIPKGQREVILPISFPNPDQLYGKNYVLALTIKTVSSGIISGNFGTMLYLISGINRADGVYTLKYKFGTNDRNYDVNPVAWYFSDVQVFTTGPTTATLRNLNASSPYPHAATSGGLPTSIGGLTPVFTFDLATNKITNIANNNTGTAAQNKTAIPNPAVLDNRYDPATKTVYASFILKEPGKADMIVYDTLIYKNPR